MATSGRELVRYQLMWQPSFPATINGRVRIYVVGERKKYVGDERDRANLTLAEDSYDPNTFSVAEIIRVGYNSTLILPFNTSVAMAQEYTPEVRNKIVQYHTLGGNSITTFGAAIRRIGLSIRVIKAGRGWESYVNGLEAVTYLSANQGRFFGALYLLGYDNFADGTERYLGRYKVTVESLTMQQRSETTTLLSADLRMFVLHDSSYQATNKARIWGSL